MNKMNQEKKFNVEEFHRGEWQPLMINVGGKKVQKHVVITEEQAESNNRYSMEYKLRYISADAKQEEVVETEEKTEMQTLREEYEAKFGKKVFNGWTVEEIKAKLAE